MNLLFASNFQIDEQVSIFKLHVANLSFHTACEEILIILTVIYKRKALMSDYSIVNFDCDLWLGTFEGIE